MEKMKAKKLRDVMVGFLLLASVTSAALLASCSEEGGLLTEPGNTGIVSSSGGDIVSGAITATFQAVGSGAAHEVGGELAGWMLGSLGLAGSSPNYTQQLNEIIAELDSIVTLLTSMNNELIEIEQTLNIINCDEQASTLQTEIGTIEELYDQYNSMLATAQGGDTVLNSTMQDWADQVLARGNYVGNTSIPTMLSTIETNIGSPTGAVYTCVTALPKPPDNSLGMDTAYYNNVDALTNYYYYYQTIALTLLSEAYHYYAWVEAGSPGNIPADSVQQVCDANGTSENECNNVIVKVNELYNSLLTQMTFGGAEYTGENLVFQYNSTKPLVWVNSLENFTSAAGSNCTSSLTNTNLCGPTVGYYYSTLSHTVYSQASGFGFASSADLDNLIDVNNASQYSTNGEYLEANGFKNMSKKTVISTDSVYFKLPKSNHHTPSVPFFNTDIPPVTNYAGDLTSVFISSDDFAYVLYPKNVGSYSCDEFYGGKHYNFIYASALGSKDSWIIAYAKSSRCSDGNYNNQFKFTDSTFSNGSFPGPPSYWPGYLTRAQYPNSGVPDTRRFLWPVLYALDASCTNGRPSTNAGGMATKCGDDFTAFLNANVPRPPTCDDSKISPSCTVLK